MSYILHIVSHTHWDREWFETFQQFRLKLVRMVDDLLDLLENDPDYRHFMLDGQTIALEDYLALRPEREEDLHRHIQTGRIMIGPWYILPDEFLVSPESTIRNLYEGERTARRFGEKMEIGYLPDTFGHIGQMPQILRSYGFDKACVWRGVDDLPCEFWWEAGDGSRVLMSFLRDSYSNAKGLTGFSLDALLTEAARARDLLAPHAQSPHLLLMNGDDFMRPQAQLGKAICATQGKLGEDVLLHSTLPAYFSGLEETLDFAALPVVQGELRSTRLSNLLPNVLSTRIWIKQRNHTCETLLEKWAEPFSTWAVLCTQNHPADLLLRQPASVLRYAWRMLMQCHPHDSICGCSIDQVHTEMHTRFDQVEQVGETITRQSLITLAECIDTQNEKDNIVSAVVVFNPVQTQRSDLATAALQGLRPGKHFQLIDEHGNVHPVEIFGWEEEVLADIVLPPTEIHFLFGSIMNAEIQGFRILETAISYTDGEVCVEMVVAEHGQANLPAWEQAHRTIEGYLKDPHLRGYRIKIIKPILAHAAFIATDVPGLGYRTFWVQTLEGEAQELLDPGLLKDTLLPPHLQPDLDAQKRAAQMGKVDIEKPETARIENEFFIVSLQADGTFELLDRRNGARYNGLNRFVDEGDRGDEYTFSSIPGTPPVQARLVRAQVQRGRIWQSMEIELEMNIPARTAEDRGQRSDEMVCLPIFTRVTLLNGVPRLDIHTRVSNQAEDHRLRAHFPAPFTVKTALHDGHFEVVERSAGVPETMEDCYEQPQPETAQRAFTAVESDGTGLLIANRGLPEVEVLQNEQGNSEVALTLLRCVGWLSRGDFPERGGHAGPGMATPEAQMKGSWSFDYAVIPFAVTDRLGAFGQAYAFQAPLCAVSASLHSAELHSRGTFLHVEPNDFVISAVKSTEDGNGWIARGYNLSSQTRTVTLRPLLAYRAAERVDLAEKHLQDLARNSAGEISFEAKGKEIVTIRFC